jgi:tetratricopeptide (TPR) repeat protein
LFVDRKTWLAARAADREAAAALRWATATHDPLEQPLAAAHALVLIERLRLRDAGAIIERLIASRPADAQVRSLALFAYSLYLSLVGHLDEALQFADKACRAAPDAKTRCLALIARGVDQVLTGHTSEALEDNAEATALARELHDDPALLAGVLVMEAQALIKAGMIDEAAARLDEARSVGLPVDANVLHKLDSQLGDLAVMDGRPADALEPYARSLERALTDGDAMQILLDLHDLSVALARLGHVAESLEVVGMAECLGGETGSMLGSPFPEDISATEERIGPARTAELKKRGRAVDPADRVARACQLARLHAPAYTPPSVEAQQRA